MRIRWCLFSVLSVLATFCCGSAFAADEAPVEVADFGSWAGAVVEEAEEVERPLVAAPMPVTEVGAWGQDPAPESVELVDGLAGWSSLDFGSRGIVRWRIEGFRSAVDAEVVADGQAQVLEDVVGIGSEEELSDVLAVRTEEGVEEFVRVPEEARSGAPSELTYEFVLPAGAKLRSTSRGASIVGVDGLDLVQISAPVSEGEFRQFTSNRMDVDEAEDTLTITPDDQEIIDGDLTIDPIFGTAETGRFWKKWCPGTDCDPRAFGVGGENHGDSSGTYDSDTGSTWGFITQARAGVYSPGNSQSFLSYISDGSNGITVDAVSFHAYFENASGAFRCRMTRAGGDSYGTAWYTGNGVNMAAEKYFPTDTIQVGFNLHNNSGGVTPATSANRCSLPRAGTDFFSVKLRDTTVASR